MNYTIWLTTACNLKCKYCYEGYDKPNFYLNKKKIDEIVLFMEKELSNSNDKKLFIDLHGGEPFLNFDEMKYLVYKILDKFQTFYNIVFGVTTNATIMNKEIFNFIVQYIPDITVSLDGSAKIHNYLRPFKNGKGSFKEALDNSKKLLKSLPNLRVRMTYNVDSVNELSNGVCNLVDNGFKIIVPAPDLFDKRWNDETLDILKDQILIIKKYLLDKPEITVSICEPVEIRNNGTCLGGITHKNIYPDGGLYPCIMVSGISEFKIGTIYEGVDTKKIQDLLIHNTKTNEECSECNLCNSCNGNRCKLINKLINNSYTQPSPLECEINHILFQLNGFSQ